MYARPRGPYILHFYICHQSGSLLAKQEKREREKKKLEFLQAEFFSLALSDQEAHAWGTLWQIFSQTGEESCRLQITDVFMP